MDAFAGRALDALVDDVRALLPDPGDPELAALVGFDTARVHPGGLGGYVGPNPDPPGDVTARRVRATVAVAVRGNDDADLGDRANAVTGALLTVAPDAATAGTFLRIAQVQRPPPATVAEPSEALPQRELRFDVVYELREGPTDTSGVITEIPLDLYIGRTGRTPRRLPVAFTADVLGEFEVVDDTGAGNQGPSAWEFEEGGPAIVQRSPVWGGTTSATANLPGTALVLRATPATPPAADVLVRAEVSSDERGIGLVFRWQDPDTFYFLLLDATDGFSRIGRKVDGAFAELDIPAVDPTSGYLTGAPLRLAVEAVGDRFAASLDGVVVAEGRDAAITEPGRVGLLTRRNPTATFSSLEVWHL